MESSGLDIYRPPAGHPLEPCVQYIFRVRQQNPFPREIILPKGNVDLLFNLGEAVRGTGLASDAYGAEEGAAWVGGLKMRPYDVLWEGRVDLLGVTMRADACAGLLPLSPAEVVSLEARELPTTPGLRMLCEQLHGMASFADQCALLMRWLTARLRPLRGTDAVRHACALLRQSRTEDGVGATAKALAVSPRHLRRLMDEHVGIGPAQYVRLARFIRAMHQVPAPGRTLTEIAHAAGYYDQAHFCREFRSFAGMTPQEYRDRANGPVPGHLYAAD
ncbi:MAG TPA: helix-turn-helix domain-containing protein [Longimicrobium sp.]|jgi:AraC-like DNA-binding protein|uniref:helix-turn-helix domain-containing protein n=1 Tax=Longimicrobium sp. TaxID=2029185 RepID=UPI002EDBA8B2